MIILKKSSMKIILIRMEMVIKNDFERALGMDSLGTDSPHHLPMQYYGEVDKKQRISFIRYKNSLETTGEEFRYVSVERAITLGTWTTTGVGLENSQDLGGGWNGNFCN